MKIPSFDMEEYAEIEALVKKSGIVCQIELEMHYNPVVSRLKQVIANGDLGKIMDPVADKILVLAAFIAFVELKLIPAWMVVIILSREMAVTSLRLVAFKKEEVISASTAGKHKTVSQMFSILLILVFITVKETGSKDLMGFWSVSLDHLYRNVIFFTMLITVTLTVISGIQYFYNNKKVFFPHDQNT
jgi:CDP-diacylglycerol--glycerol-3-phosphate 3-phosphatidyltransferase